MPLYKPAHDLPKGLGIERDFFQSLSILEKHYGLQLTDYRSLPYPYKVLMAEREAKRKLKTKRRYRALQVVQEDNGQTFLTVTETFDSDFGLYYIPVMPIYDLWQNPEHAHCGELLTAVCAYLYAEAGIDYYRDEDTYMYRNYEYLEEWINERAFEADDEEDYCRQKYDYGQAALQGDYIQEKMMTNGFRHSLGSLIANFNAVTAFEKQCLTVAKTTWELWQAFPEHNLYKHASLQGYEPEDYDDDYIGMHEYFSFVGSVRDSISDDLKTMVNDDFNERTRYQEPEIVTCFNHPKAVYTDELAYEERLLKLIDDLCTLLYDKP